MSSSITNGDILDTVILVQSWTKTRSRSIKIIRNIIYLTERKTENRIDKHLCRTAQTARYRDESGTPGLPENVSARDVFQNRFQHSQSLESSLSDNNNFKNSSNKILHNTTKKKTISKLNKRPAPAPPKSKQLDMLSSLQVAKSKEIIDESWSKSLNFSDCPLQKNVLSKKHEGKEKVLINKNFEQVPSHPSSAKRRLALVQSLLSSENLETNSCNDKQNQKDNYMDTDVFCRRILMPQTIRAPVYPSPEEFKNNQMESFDVNLDFDRDLFSSDSSAHYNSKTLEKKKSRKGPAPAIPILSCKTLQINPLDEIRHELEIIEVQQQGLEKQGVILERMIRDRCEGVIHQTVDSHSEFQKASPKNSKEVEELILQLFELVNEKNELFRRRAELTHIRKQHRLEQAQADIEVEIRTLMRQSEHDMSNSDKIQVDTLITRLIETVKLRNNVIDSLERDRLREAQEDLSIQKCLDLYKTERDTFAMGTNSKTTRIKMPKIEKIYLKVLKRLKKHMSDNNDNKNQI